MRALLSVYDKTGIVELARELRGLGWDLVSSGGTATALRDAGLAVTDTAELTGFPAILGHRVVTLHPKVHGGILADRRDPDHQADMAEYGIDPIDLVVVNLYPFRSNPSIELIDVGGPTMVRAAAKNHKDVGILTDPVDYGVVIDELKRDGVLSAGTKRSLARKAFAHTAAYDAAIVAWLDEGSDDPLPPTLHLALERVQDLRYGENPHQTGARYRTIGSTSWWDDVTQHGGMALSYLNLFDADAAWGLANDLKATTGQPAVAIIKHANPCGAAAAGSLADAYQRAFECDERSAFGGIVALSDVVDEATVTKMVAAAQADLVIAPGYADGVIEALAEKRKNTRLLTAPVPTPDPLQYRQLTGAWLVQDAHNFAAARGD
ncbi:MAG: bifunctional phosphoribosylaminoimidazolecarboxamide formyltransferase/IMP cyclohydrolase, partial [Actinomycetota bacterium]|nr:bifunctional phosphoribosylaminoimidazolecarboxamide formyltransferase/IMP cyclohydrolase [Actinomycetota bacterium]